MAEYSVSMSFDETVAIRHDRRDYTPNNADRGLADRNVTLADCPDVRAAFDEFFRPAIDRYNDKQKRADRKKSYDYFDGVVSGRDCYGKGDEQERPVYEYVIQIGNKDDNGVTDDDFDTQHWTALKESGQYDEASAYVKEHLNDDPDREEMKASLIETLRKLPEKYPHIKFWGIYVHDDEPGGTCHAHIICTPWSDDYKKGVDTRCSLRGGLRQMGFETVGGQLAVNQWQNDLKNEVANDMAARGYDRQYMSNTDRHLSVGAFKLKQELTEREEAVTAREQAIDDGSFLSKREAAIQTERELISMNKKIQARTKQEQDTRQSELDTRQAELDARQSELDEEAELIRKLKIQQDKTKKKQDDRDTAQDAREAAQNAREAELDKKAEQLQLAAQNAVQARIEAIDAELQGIKSSHLIGKPHRVTGKDGKTVTLHEQGSSVSEAIQRAKQIAAAPDIVQKQDKQDTDDHGFPH